MSSYAHSTSLVVITSLERGKGVLGAGSSEGKFPKLRVTCIHLQTVVRVLEVAEILKSL